MVIIYLIQLVALLVQMEHLRMIQFGNVKLVNHLVQNVSLIQLIVQVA